MTTETSLWFNKCWRGLARPGVFEKRDQKRAVQWERWMAPMLLVTCLLTGTALNGKPMLYSQTGCPIRRERARLNRLQRNNLPLFLLILKEALPPTNTSSTGAKVKRWKSRFRPTITSCRGIFFLLITTKFGHVDASEANWHKGVFSRFKNFKTVHKTVTRHIKAIHFSIHFHGTAVEQTCKRMDFSLFWFAHFQVKFCWSSSTFLQSKCKEP